MTHINFHQQHFTCPSTKRTSVQHIRSTDTDKGKKMTGTVSSGYNITYCNEVTNRECMSMTIHKQ